MPHRALRWTIGLTATACLANACSGARESAPDPIPPAALSLAEALRAVEQAQAPAGVDPALWRKLTAELARVLASRGAQKFTSAPPSGPSNAVSDLAFDAPGAAGQFSWTYRSIGDYDQNSEVNLADLTPIGQHFNKGSAAPDWANAQLADGDSNGEVNIADITPIGMNFLAGIEGYELQTSASGEAQADWTSVEDIPFSAGAAPGGQGRKAFLLSPAASLVDGAYYRVCPFQGGGAARVYGEPSNSVQVSVAPPNPLPSFWSGPGGGPANRNALPITGPAAGTNLQALALGQQYRRVALGPDGNLYVDGLNLNVYSFALDGALRWEYEVGPKNGAWALGPDGTTYAGTLDGQFVALGPAGNLAAQQALSTGVTAFAAHPDGGVAAVTSGFSLLRLEADGTEQWAKALPGEEFIACAAAPNGNVLGLTRRLAGAPQTGNAYDNRLYCYAPGGSELWVFEEFDPFGDAGPYLSAAPDSWAILIDADQPRGVSPDGQSSWLSDKVVYEFGGRIAMDLGPDGNLYYGTWLQSTDEVGIVAPDGTVLDSFSAPADVQSPPVGGVGERVWWSAFDGLKTRLLSDSGSEWQYPDLAVWNSGLQAPEGDLICASGGSLYRIEAGQGEAWSLPADPAYPWPPAFREDGRFYVSQDGLRLKDRNFDELWRYDMGAAEGQYSSQPVITPSGNVLVRGNYKLYCVNAEGGEVWVYDGVDRSLGSPLAGSGGLTFVSGYDAGEGGSELYKLDSSGQLLDTWELASDSLTGLALYHDGSQDLLFASVRTAGGGYLRCMDTSFSEVYTFTPGNGSYPGAPAVDADGFAYVSATVLFTPLSNEMYRVDPDGNLDQAFSDWRPNTNDPPSLGQDGRLCFVGLRELDSNFSPRLHVVLLDHDGTEQWSFPLYALVNFRPLLDAGSSAYFTHEGRLHCIAPNGTELCQAFTGLSDGAPAPGPDGALYCHGPGFILSFGP